MQLHFFRVPTELNQPHWRFLCSDLHLGSPNCDVKRIGADLAAARKAGARIVLNGDVFDAIDGRDKRATPSTLTKELRGKEDLCRAAVDYAAALLGPYADVIDVIGLGNHEEKWIKWNSFDPIGALIRELNHGLEKQGCNHTVRHGGIAGFIRTRFVLARDGNPPPSVAHTLFYFHGAGGDSPVTKGTIDFNRKQQFVANAITVGHRHNRLFMDDVFVELTSSGLLRHCERKAIQTGSYYLNHRKTTQKDPLSYSYAESIGNVPKPLGGMFLVLTPVRDRGVTGASGRQTSLLRVEQDVCTSSVAAAASRPTL